MIPFDYFHQRIGPRLALLLFQLVIYALEINCFPEIAISPNRVGLNGCLKKNFLLGPRFGYLLLNWLRGLCLYFIVLHNHVEGKRQNNNLAGSVSILLIQALQ
jgi:hypothetical protein